MEIEKKERYRSAVRQYLARLHKRHLPLKIWSAEAFPVDSVDVVFSGLKGYNWAFVAETRTSLTERVRYLGQSISLMQDNLRRFRENSDVADKSIQVRIASAEEHIAREVDNLRDYETSLTTHDIYEFCVDTPQAFETENDIIETARLYVATHFPEYPDIAVIWDGQELERYIRALEKISKLSDGSVPYEEFRDSRPSPDIRFLYEKK
jgi:hypothetical protein